MGVSGLVNGGGTPGLNAASLDPAADTTTPLPSVMEEEPDWTPGIVSCSFSSFLFCEMHVMLICFYYYSRE